jgi:hypothetical protein
MKERKIKMSKKYVLQKHYISKDHLNRLVKRIVDNTQEDRARTLSLFEDAKSRMDNADNTVEYSEVLKSTATILKQFQDVNHTLLKAMGIIQTFLSKSSSSKKGADPVNLFDGLSKLTGLSNDEEEDD